MFRRIRQWLTGQCQCDACRGYEMLLANRELAQQLQYARQLAQHYAREAQREHQGQRIPPTGGSSTAPPQPTDWSDCEVGLKSEAGAVVLYLVAHGKRMRVRLDPTLAWRLGEELQRQAPVARDQARDAAVAESAREDGQP